MGAIAAAVSKRGLDVSRVVVAMLRELNHRGSHAYGIASSTTVFHAENLQELENAELKASSIIGYNLSLTFPRDRKQPIKADGFSLAFDGRIYPSKGKTETQIVREVLQTPENAKELIQELNGDYAFAIAKERQVVAGRSVLGVCPLYYGENSETAAVASEKKALWRVGINKVYSFPCGNVAIINSKGFHFREAKTLKFPKKRETRMETAVKRLYQLLTESVEKRLSDLKEVAIAFSGGLDSSLIAFLAKKCGAETTLIWTGLENREELKHAEKAAQALGLPLEAGIYKGSDVEEALPKVLWLIEDPNPVNASIAVPVYWTAEKVSALSFKVLMAGQGSDELFGGYQRYLKVYRYSDVKTLEKMLFEDSVKAYETNYERDSKTCAFHHVELRLPFADYSLAQYVLNITAKLKIASVQDKLRKQVLRETAKNMGLPKFITEKPKKAIQYATGVNQTLKRIARRKGLSVKEYVGNVFRQVCVEPYKASNVMRHG